MSASSTLRGYIVTKNQMAVQRRVITLAKATPERAWPGEVSAVVLQQAPADLNTADRNSFASVTGRGRKPA